MKNPFVQLCAVLWFFGAIGCWACNNSPMPIIAAAAVTIVAGIGYVSMLETKMEFQASNSALNASTNSDASLEKKASTS